MTADRQMAIELIEEAVSAGARRHKACGVLEITVRTLQRWQKSLAEDRQLSDQRKLAAAERQPANKLTEIERRCILAISNSQAYRSLPPSQIVPRLADEGEYMASESTFYRVLREADQVNRRGRAKPPRSVSKPQGYKATGPNQLWSWDITFLASTIRGEFYRLYMLMDIYSRKIVGWEVHDSESAAHAATLMRKTCLAEGVHHAGLVLHSDNGAPMKGATMLATLQRLGVVPSFSRPSVSDDNPYSESLFRTLKYTPSYPSKPFESIEAARQWVHTFVGWYNDEHRHSAIRYVTPNERHAGKDRNVLLRRDGVYKAAQARNPQRWSGKTRDWNPVAEVWLNPPNQNQAGKTEEVKAA